MNETQHAVDALESRSAGTALGVVGRMVSESDPTLAPRFRPRLEEVARDRPEISWNDATGRH